MIQGTHVLVQNVCIAAPRFLDVSDLATCQSRGATHHGKSPDGLCTPFILLELAPERPYLLRAGDGHMGPEGARARVEISNSVREGQSRPLAVSGRHGREDVFEEFGRESRERSSVVSFRGRSEGVVTRLAADRVHLGGMDNNRNKSCVSDNMKDLGFEIVG